jgi:four helix bundle protein
MTKQIIRSSTSAALNYGEAQGAESKRDFIHKSSVVIKELRETKISLHIVRGLIRSGKEHNFVKCLDECDQLVAIFYKTIITAKRKG